MVILYGAGAWGQAACDLIQKTEKVLCFLDKNPILEETIVNGLPVYNPEKVKEEKKECDVVVCIVAAPYDEVKKYLITLGYSRIYSLIDYIGKKYATNIFANFWRGKENLLEVAKINIEIFSDSISKLQYIHAINWFWHREDEEIVSLDRKKYFMKLIIPILSTSDIFLDTALLDGEYYKQVEEILGKVKEYFGFCLYPTGSGEVQRRGGVLKGEPGNINGIKKVRRVGFMKPFTEEKIFNIQQVKIDDVMEKRKYTFLRGYSMESLLPIVEGAMQTIKKYRPICALNIGHFEQDFVEIPQLFTKIVPEYYYLFRQHSYQGSDCIFYAIPNERNLEIV